MGESSGFEHPLVFSSFGVSLVVTALALVLYFRWRFSKNSKRPSESKAAVGKTFVSESHTGYNLDPTSATALEADGSPTMVRLQMRRQGRPIGDWGSSVVSLGIDLGSHLVKVHSHQNGMVQEMKSVRGVVTMTHEGVTFGELEAAMESMTTTMYSIILDLTTKPDAFIRVEDVVIKPYQALAGLLIYITREYTVMPCIAVSVAPYHVESAKVHFPLAAVCARANRFFVVRQSAALIAALLHVRRTATDAKMKGTRIVVMIDLGHSGVSAYVCELRQVSGSVLFETHRTEGVQSSERELVLEIADQVEKATNTKLNDLDMLRLVELAMSIRDEFSIMPEYLSSANKKITRTTSAGVTVEITRGRFVEILQKCQADVEAVHAQAREWIDKNIAPVTTNGVPAPEKLELHLTGNGFKVRELRWSLEPQYDRNCSTYQKISVSQGLALVAAMQHPLYSGQRFDVYPLFESRTVAEMGVRTAETEGRASSILTPLLGGGRSSQNDRSQGRKSGKSPRPSALN